MLMNEIKEDLINKEMYPVHALEDSTVKMSVLSKFINRLNAILIKIVAIFLIVIDKCIL